MPGANADIMLAFIVAISAVLVLVVAVEKYRERKIILKRQMLIIVTNTLIIIDGDEEHLNEIKDHISIIKSSTAVEDHAYKYTFPPSDKLESEGASYDEAK